MDATQAIWKTITSLILSGKAESVPTIRANESPKAPLNPPYTNTMDSL